MRYVLKKVNIMALMLICNSCLAAKAEPTNHAKLSGFFVYLDIFTKPLVCNYEYKFNYTKEGIQYLMASSYARDIKLKRQHHPNNMSDQEYRKRFHRNISGVLTSFGGKFHLQESDNRTSKSKVKVYKFDGLRYMIELGDSKRGFILEYPTAKAPNPLEALLYVPNAFSHVPGKFFSERIQITDWIRDSGERTFVDEGEDAVTIKSFASQVSDKKPCAMLEISLDPNTYQPIYYSYGLVEIDNNFKILKKYRPNIIKFDNYKQLGGFTYPSLITKETSSKFNNPTIGFDDESSGKIYELVGFKGDPTVSRPISKSIIEILAIRSSSVEAATLLCEPRKSSDGYFYYDYNLDKNVKFQ